MNWSLLRKFGKLLRLDAYRAGTRARRLRLEPLEGRDLPAAPLQFFFVPMPEEPMLDSLEAIGIGSQGNDMTSYLTIAASENNTIIYYDHWENGYEANLGTPTQTVNGAAFTGDERTQIWGDGNAANGSAPGVTGDLINAGTIISFRNDVPANPRMATNIFFDGRDKIGSDKTISMSRAQFPMTTGSVLSSGVEVRDTRYFDLNYSAPVGTDTAGQGPTGARMFEYAAFFVMASLNNTTVEIDRDDNGVFEQTVVLNQGENVVSAANVLEGGRVRANKPVQVNLVTGDIDVPSPAFASRSYTLFSDAQATNDYFTPVGLAGAADPIRLFVFNPNTFPITVTPETRTGVGTAQTIPARSSAFFDVTTFTGTRLFSANNFVALGTYDQADSQHDWGFSLQPVSALSQIAQVGLGVGNSANPPMGNGNTSPIWVTPLQNTTVYADWDGNPTTGLLGPEPITGSRYDQAFTLSRLQSQQVRDGSGDDDNSGMRLFTVDGTLISTVWGQDVGAPAGAPGFDAGSTVPAIPVPEFYKTSTFAPGGDVNGDGFFNSGDRVRYTLRVRHIGTEPISNALVTDTLPSQITYVANSTFINPGSGAVAIPDAGTTAFPLDEAGHTIGNINPGTTILITFDVTINGGLTAGSTSVMNRGLLTFDIFRIPAVDVIDLRGVASDRVWYDIDGDGTQDASEPGIPGATVTVTWFGPNGTVGGGDDQLYTATTGANGIYAVTNLPEGNFGVAVSGQPNGLTTLTAGPSTFSLLPGQVRTDIDFGFRGTGTIGNQVFNDLNFNGVQNGGGEVGVSGAAVVLTWFGFDGVLGGTDDVTYPTATTAAAGTYSFANLPGGNFRAQFTAPSGFVLAAQDQGGNDTLDSDPNPTTGLTATITLAAGGTNNDTDAGMFRQADLSITKTDGSATYTPGAAITYTIVVTNAGPSFVTGATVADTIPANISGATWAVTYSGVGSTGPVSGSGNIGATVDLAVGGTATFTLSGTVLSTATGNLVNTATVTAPSGTNDPTPGNNSATDTDTADPRADLQITKTDGTATYTPGVSTTYTIVVTNSGPSNVIGATVTDNLPAQVGSATWTVAYAGGASGPAGGSGNISATLNLPSGATATFTVVANTLSSATGDLVNTATVAPPTGVTDPTPGNNSATDTDTSAPRADLSITKTDGTATYTPGLSTTYTIVVTNTGPSNVIGATVTDNLPAQIGSASWTVSYSGGASGPAGGSGNINASLNLPSGATATFTVVANTLSSATGDLVNTATVAPPTGTTDPTPGNNSATDTDTASPRADLSITKTDGAATYTPGLSTTYTIVVTNSGPSNVIGATVTDNLPAQIGSATWTVAYAGGASGPAGGSGNISATLNLPSGATATFTVVANTLSSATGDLVNTATVAPPTGTTDPTPGNNSATDTDTSSPRADLSITKTDGTATYTPGLSTTYTIVVTNSGPSNVIGATVTDNLPAQIGSATWTVAYAGGASGPAGGSGNISATLNLPSGATATFTVVANTLSSATGDLVNTATVAPPTGTTDPTPGNNTATDTDTAAPRADLQITKTDGTTTYTANGSTTYTIVVTNAGPSNVTGATVTDNLPASITSATWTAAYSAGASGPAGGSGNISATVNLASGATATFTVVAAISPAASGNLVNTATVATPTGTTDPTPGNNSATDTDTEGGSPDLFVTKTDGVTVTTPGGTLVYTITYGNAGTRVSTGVTLFETLPVGTTFNPALSDSNWVDFGGGDYRLDVGTLAVGAGGTVAFAVTVNSPVAAGQTVVDNLVEIADDETNGPDPNPGDNDDTDTDALTAAPDLVVTKDDGVLSTTPGSTLIYTITVQNVGTQNATGVNLTDTLPANTSFVSATGGGSFAAGAVTWNIGSLAAGSSVTLTVTVQVAASVPAGVNSLVNSATANDDGTNGPDPTPSDNTDTDTDTLIAAPDLSITKTDGVTSTIPGSTLTYTLTYANNGNEDAAAVVVTETRPAGTTFNPAANPGWSEVSPGVYEFAVGPVAAGASGMITFVLTVNSPAVAGQTQVVNTATVANVGGTDPDPTPGDNSTTDTDTLTAAPDLVVTKDDGGATVQPNGTVTYTITVTNAGNQNATGVVLTDPVPANTTFTSASNGGTLSGSNVVWNIGSLAAGATVTRTVTLTVNPTVAAGVTAINNTASANDDGTNGPDPTPPDNTDTDTTPLIATPDLVVTKDDGVTTARPGDTLVYTVTVTNAGNQGATGVVVVDTLPANTTFVSATGGGSFAAGAVTWNVGSLAAGASVSFTVTVQVAASVPAGAVSLVNMASANDDGTNGPDPTPGDNTDTDTDTLDATPDLVVTKTDGTISTAPGSTLTYIISYSNVGNQDATGVVITETLPAGTTFNAAASPGWVSAGGGTFTFAVGSLAAGASGTATFVVTVDAPATAGRTQVVNSVAVSDDGTNGPDPTPGDNTSTDTDTLIAAPDLVVTKDDGVSVAAPGDTLTYTITVRNVGNQDATGVVLRDTIPGLTAFVSATGGGTHSGGVVTWNLGNLAGGASITVTVTVQVNATVPAGATSLVNTANANDDGTNGPDPTPPDNTGTDTDTLGGLPDLTLTNSDGVLVTTPGSTQVYALGYANIGNRGATGVVITETLPVGTTFNAASSDPNWIDQGNGTFTLALGSLATGATGTVFFAVTVNNPAAAGQNQVVNPAVIADDGSNGADPTPANNAATDIDTLTATPDLVVTKDDGVTTARPGDTLVYTVTVTNAGNQGATGVVVVDALPANTSFVGATGGGTFAAGAVTWNVGNLAAGASVSFTVTVQVAASVPAGATALANTASASDDGTNGPDPTPGDNTDTDTDTLDATPDLVVTKTDGVTTARPGDTLTYTITLTNVGNQDATGVTLSDALPANTTFVSASSGGTASAGSVTWAIGNLAAGVSVTHTVTLQVNASVPAGAVSLVNTASATDDGTNGPDPTPPDNTGDDTDTLDAAPDLSVTKTDGLTVVIPGSSIVYTLSYRNTGNQDATGVVITETLPAGTTFNAAASSPGWAVQRNGTFTIVIGTLAAGANGTATFAVAINSPAPTGQTQIVNTASITDDGTNGPDPTPGDNTGTDTDDLNRLPLAVDDVATADEDNPVTVPNADLLVNDDQGDAPAVVIAVSPTSTQGGTVVLGPNGVVYTPPANFTGADSFTYTIRDTNGDTSTATVRLSVVPSDRDASIGDRVWVDYNGDGQQDADEPGLAGVTLTLTRAGRDGDFNTPADNTTFTVVTGPNGAYRFDNLSSGLYRIAATSGLPVGAVATFDPDGGNDGQTVFTLANGAARTDLDFGYRGTSRVTGIVFRDYHVNGQFEPNAPTPETGIAGVTITLTGTDVAGNTITRTAVTGADGSYGFVGLLAGTYTLTEGPTAPFNVLGGFYDGLDTAGAAGGTVGNDVINSIALGTGVNGDGYSFGENPPADPFGFVYVDRNHNGVRDAGEPGIPGVAVTVSGIAFADTLLAHTLTAAEVAGGLTAITDANGRWEFLVIPPGTYTITEAQPSGYADGAEQNADPNGPFTVVVGADTFSNVELTPSPVRGPFNFAELLVPGPGGPLPPMNFFPEQPGDMSKRMFLGSTAEGRVIDTSTLTDPNFASFNPGTRPAAFLVTAQDAGGGWVRVFDFAAGVERFRFQPFGDFRGGVRVATADVTGDGIPDVIAAAGPGGGPVVKVFDGDTGAEVGSTMAFESGFRGGLQVAAGDFNGDFIADIVVTPDEGGGPIVRVLDGRTLAQLANFFALDEGFRGGLRIAAGDINRDGATDLVVTAGVGGGPRVAVYDGRTVTTTPTRLMNDFFGFAPELRNGFWVSAADVDGDTFADVVLGAGAGGSPRVAVYSGRLIASAGGPVMIASILAGDEASRDGARVAAVDLDGDGRAELASAGGVGAEPIVYLYDPLSGGRRDAFRAFPSDFLGGVFVG